MPDKKEENENQNSLHYLRGTYATSYLGYIHTVPRPAVPNLPGAPQIAAYQWNGGSTFTQVDGYRLHSFAAWLDFDGNGLLNGSGYVNRGGMSLSQLTFNGSYSVDSTLPFTGAFSTVDTVNFVKVEHFWIMSDNWNRLEFMVKKTTDKLGADYRQFVVAGTLKRV